MPSTRVVVTGLGTTSPVGGDVPTTWQALLAGTSGIRRLTDDWVDLLPVKIGGRVAVEPSESGAGIGRHAHGLPRSARRSPRVD